MRLPGADIIIACEILFGVSSQELFPKLYADIEERVIARASELFEVLEGKKGPVIERKKELLSAVLNRAIIRISSSAEHES